MTLTPDGRSWLTTKEMAARLLKGLKHDLKGKATARAALEVHGAAFEAALAAAYEETGYTTEFKILRLTEKLKDGLMRGDFADLQSVKDAFDAIYTKSILDQYDDEGNLE